MPTKPSEKEEENFARMEFERKRKIEAEKHRRLAKTEETKLREMHCRRCPKCGMELIEIRCNGVHTDKCPECGGVWIDAEEFAALSKIDQSKLNGLFRIFSN